MCKGKVCTNTLLKKPRHDSPGPPRSTGKKSIPHHDDKDNQTHSAPSPRLQKELLPPRLSSRYGRETGKHCLRARPFLGVEHWSRYSRTSGLPLSRSPMHTSKCSDHGTSNCCRWKSRAACERISSKVWTASGGCVGRVFAGLVLRSFRSFINTWPSQDRIPMEKARRLVAWSVLRLAGSQKPAAGSKLGFLLRLMVAWRHARVLVV